MDTDNIDNLREQLQDMNHLMDSIIEANYDNDNFDIESEDDMIRINTGWEYSDSGVVSSVEIQTDSDSEPEHSVNLKYTPMIRFQDELVSGSESDPGIEMSDIKKSFRIVEEQNLKEDSYMYILTINDNKVGCSDNLENINEIRDYFKNKYILECVLDMEYDSHKDDDSCVKIYTRTFNIFGFHNQLKYNIVIDKINKFKNILNKRNKND